MEPISVVVPVGNDPVYLDYLLACFESIASQTYKPYEIIMVSDQADEYKWIKEKTDFQWRGGNGRHEDFYYSEASKIHLKVYKTVWSVGVPDAFNFGIALSSTNLVFTIGSDDIMFPTCLEKCVEAYDKHQKEGWYFVKYQIESGDILQIQNNTAMVTKKLWEETGGFPPSAGVGACDALLLSIMMKHMPDRIIPVESDEPLCWLREGDHQDTRKNGWLFAEEIISIRNKETLRWKKQN